jgi:4-cresol dehydrogenase (hydroxylating)
MDEHRAAASLTALSGAVGEANVLAREEDLESLARTTIGVRRRIAAAVRPGSVEEVRAVLAVAREHGLRLQPVSTGRNWGYGAASPMGEDDVILDLSRMNRILEVDPEMAYAVLEPGVTQGQLYRYLEEHDLPLQIDPNGAGPSCSIPGNALERGYGITPYGDHFACVCGLELVLPTGEVVRTGFWHHPESRSSHLYPYGVGPRLDGLFTQSNLAVVTKMGYWLMPRPERIQAFFFQVRDEAGLEPVAEAVRKLLLGGGRLGSINLLSRDRVALMRQAECGDERGALGEGWRATLDRIAEREGLGAWNGVGALYGTPAEVAATRRSVKKLLRPHVRSMAFVTRGTLRWIRRLGGPVEMLTGLKVRRLARLIENTLGILEGVPSEVSLGLAYAGGGSYRPGEGSLHPARDGCGLQWLAPVVPLRAADLRAFLNLLDPIFARHGIPFAPTFTTVNARAVDCTLPILFDPSADGETGAARSCHDEALDACLKAGFVPYRLGLQSMEAVTGTGDSFWRTVGRIKDALDPGGILAPGRYDGRAGVEGTR